MSQRPHDTPLLPARMLNEFVYCPRLAILEWVEGEWAESPDTIEGAFRHTAVDRPGHRVRRRPRREEEAESPEPEAARLQIRSAEFSDAELGITAKIDLVEVEDGRVQPVDVKKGKRPHVAKGAWDPERVQLCAQGLLLRAHGHSCDSGALYFAGSNERVSVEFDEELVGLTRSKLRECIETAEAGRVPPPLVDSPKCPRCSLVGICLPDEMHWLVQGGSPPRRLTPSARDTFPVYVQQPGANVRKNGGLLEVHAGGEKIGEARIEEVSELVLFGQAQVSTAMIHALCRREIPIVYLSGGGWLQAITRGLPHKNITLRQQQFRAADDPAKCLSIARQIVHAKIQNMRTLLRRNAAGSVEKSSLRALREAARSALRADSLESLLGHEGSGTRLYFEGFPGMLKGSPELLAGFSFEGRSRRPPRDRVNAMLSFGYAMLARELTHVAASVGLDPYLGFLHAPRYGRPALALDLIEPFRPLVADSVCITLVNNGEIRPGDFVERMGSVNLNRSGRAKFLAAMERRLAQEIVHPALGYRVSYRRVFETEARLLGRHLTGELSAYRPIVTR